MSKLLLTGAFLCIAPISATADELLCTGTSWIQSKPFENSIVFRIEPSTRKASVETASLGRGEGILNATPDMYYGSLVASKGGSYWVNLHRYTGRLVIGTGESPGPQGKIEFDGTCVKTVRKF